MYFLQKWHENTSAFMFSNLLYFNFCLWSSIFWLPYFTILFVSFILSLFSFYFASLFSHLSNKSLTKVVPFHVSTSYPIWKIHFCLFVPMFSHYLFSVIPFIYMTSYHKYLTEWHQEKSPGVGIRDGECCS